MKRNRDIFKIGIVGCGYWGPNYIRIIENLDNAKIHSCCDLAKNNLLNLRNHYQIPYAYRDFKKVAQDPEIDAVIITTPLHTHYEIARYCIKHNKHVLIEKPLTKNSRQAQSLHNLARKYKVVAMVGHVYQYNPGIHALQNIISSGKLGQIYYINAVRLGLGPIRKHANALWDLVTHDISTLLYVLNKKPKTITALGESYIQKKVNDLTFVSLTFPSRIVCTIHASWIAPEKVRKITVVGSKGMAVFDDVNKAETLKIYERSIERSRLDSTPEYTDHQLVINIGDVYIPRIQQSEPLKNQVIHFLKCIKQKRKPLSDAKQGLRVVQILEAAERSIRNKRTESCRYAM